MQAIAQNVSNPKVKFATRLAMANRDLLEADAYLTALTALPKTSGEIDAENLDTIRLSLLASAIVSYSRPFGGNKGAGIATSQIKIDDYKKINPTLHDKAIMLRNKAVAHGDADVVPVQIIDHNQPNHLVVAQLPFDLAKEISAHDLGKQVTELLVQIQQKLHALSEELRKIPGALGSPVHLTFAELNDDSEQPV